MSNLHRWPSLRDRADLEALSRSDLRPHSLTLLPTALETAAGPSPTSDLILSNLLVDWRSFPALWWIAVQECL